MHIFPAKATYKKAPQLFYTKPTNQAVLVVYRAQMQKIVCQAQLVRGRFSHPVYTTMSPPSYTITVRAHRKRVANECSKAEPLTPHSCKYCDKLLVRLPDIYPVHDVHHMIEPPIKGLWSSSIDDFAQKGCPLFKQCLQDGSGAESVRHKSTDGPNNDSLKITTNLKAVMTKARRSLRPSPRDDDEELTLFVSRYSEGEEQYNDVHLPKPAWRGRINNGRAYALGIAEGSSVPSWLRTNRMWRLSAATKQAFNAARGWLHECYEHSIKATPSHVPSPHRYCTSIPRTFVPSRLLCVPDEDATTTCVIGTGGLGYVPWCSLSYCWGGPQRMQSTKANFPGDRRELRLSDLPRTILDALLVAKELNIPYIWIDSLCILQDDPDDMQKELIDMVNVYKHSIVTLLAATASSVSEGFLQPRDFGKDLKTLPIRLRCQTDSGTEGHIVLYELQDSERADPVDTRGWVRLSEYN
jgi:hypothetical protein